MPRAYKGGRAAKARGTRSEEQAARVLAGFGFRRVPLSGAAPGWPGDLVRTVEDGRRIRLIENKRRVGALGYVQAWFQQANADVVRVDPGPRGEALYILREDVFTALLKEAGYAIPTEQS